MLKVLHVSASPRGSQSASLEVAAHFLEILAKTVTRCEIETLDLWSTELPEMSGETMAAAYAHMAQAELSPAQASAFDGVIDAIEGLRAADLVLFSLPMWNFSIPYKLKHYIDLVVVRGMTYELSPETGYKGLVTGKRAVCVYARGGTYRRLDEGETRDFQSPYLRCILGFIGIQDMREVFIQGSAFGEEAKTKAIEAAKRQAESLVAQLRGDYDSSNQSP